MFSLSLASFVAALVAFVFVRQIYRFTYHLNAAKQSGIPYVVVPVTSYQPLWLLTYQLWMPLLRRLPSSWTSSWIDFVVPGWSWTHLHRPYKRIGSDIFLTVSPFGNVLWICHADVISQVTGRRNDFPKDTRMYKFIDIFGKNLVTTEGNDWTRHRKATAPTFSERNNHIVWMETLYQAQQLVNAWNGKNSSNTRTISNALEDAMTLSLHVISQAGFGRRMLWPGEANTRNDNTTVGTDTDYVPESHMLSFKDALSTVLDKLPWVAFFPSWILAIFPFKAPKEARRAYFEWSMYMDEMYQEKRARILAEGSHDEREDGLDLLGALIRNSAKSLNLTSGEDKGKTIIPEQGLSEREVLGNAFIFMFGGHETTASTVYFALVFLALNPSCQRDLQADLNAQFPPDRPITTWDYDTDVPRLLATMPGAAINETLRLIPPLMQLPKTTLAQPQPLDLDGRTIYVPPHTRINIVITAAHRNPNFWPKVPGSLRSRSRPDADNKVNDNDDDDDLDLHNFRPERWFLSSPTEAQDPDTRTPFRPYKGAYIPFSDGRRSCIGRRFALVEAVAVLAVLFRSHSIELAVDDLASDAEVTAMSRSQRAALWEQAATKATWFTREGLKPVSFERKVAVPLRFVKRGGERFWDL